MTVTYREHSPPAGLRPWVRCLWTFEDARPDRTVQRIPPDGCAELIIHLREPYEEQRANGRFVRQPRVIFAGQMSAPIRLRATGPITCVGLRFEPDGAWPWFGEPMSRATDQRLDASDRLPAALRARTADVALALLAAEVEQAISAAGRPVDRILRAEIARLATGKPAASDAAARRRLQRAFLARVGVSPQTLQSVLRFRRVFDRAAAPDAGNWLTIALDAGYFDQPQMARDFQRFLGCTATAWAREQLSLGRAIASQPIS